MKILSKFLFFFASFLGVISCKDEVLVKPSGRLSLKYAPAEYRYVSTPCPYSFEINNRAELVQKEDCNFNIIYPEMKATLHLTYQKVGKDNLDSLLRDAQKLAYNHSIKASSIPEQPFINPDANVYGMFYMINGDAATHAGFYMTDSINHFLNGALYFAAKPNFDSVYPAVHYLREDIRHLIETIEWK